ncbi:hypothetical protein CB1_000733001 [Camelus ferus]|nr:hypothetical protein CB1_000733001 [Camelus ferus]
MQTIPGSCGEGRAAVTVEEDSTQDMGQDLVYRVPCSISLQEGQVPHETNRCQDGLRGEGGPSGRSRDETYRVWRFQQQRLEKLVVNLLTAILSSKPSYLNTFLGIYRAFNTNQQMLELLFQKGPQTQKCALSQVPTCPLELNAKELVGPVPSATVELDAEFQEDRNELKQKENTIYTNPDLLSYTDKLCYQEDFITKPPTAGLRPVEDQQGKEH